MATASELRQKRTTIIADARSLLSEMEATNDAKALADLEKRHDALMADLDTLDAQLKRHEQTETQERLDANFKAGRNASDDESRRAAQRPTGADTVVSGVDVRAPR